MKAASVILVAGAGRGLGRQAAVALGARGAAIAVNDINPDSAAETARLVTEAGGQAAVHIADVSKKFPVQAMFNAIEDDWGRLTAVVNNARVVPHRLLVETDEWDWRRTLDVNLTGAFVLFQVAGRVLREAGGGSILQLVQAPEPAPGLAAYESTRLGLAGLAAVAGQELAAAGIRLATVAYPESEYAAALAQILSFLGFLPEQPG